MRCLRKIKFTPFVSFRKLPYANVHTLGLQSKNQLAFKGTIIKRKDDLCNELFKNLGVYNYVTNYHLLSDVTDKKLIISDVNGVERLLCENKLTITFDNLFSLLNNDDNNLSQYYYLFYFCKSLTLEQQKIIREKAIDHLSTIFPKMNNQNEDIKNMSAGEYLINKITNEEFFDFKNLDNFYLPGNDFKLLAKKCFPFLLKHAKIDKQHSNIYTLDSIKNLPELKNYPYICTMNISEIPDNTIIKIKYYPPQDTLLFYSFSNI